MSEIYITEFDAICNLGENIDEIFSNAINGKTDRFVQCDYIIKGKSFPLGVIKGELPEILNPDFNTRCSKILLKCYLNIKEKLDKRLEKYGKEKVGIFCATTNSGTDEFEISNNPVHTEIAQPALFLKDYLGLLGPAIGVSSACSSGIKTFITAESFLEKGIVDAAIVAGAEPISNLSVFGFNSLEILSDKHSNPFSKNRTGMNISEGGAIFFLEKDAASGIKILATGETSDAYHISTPEPTGEQAAKAISDALHTAKLSPKGINYINLHGTGTLANDLMEANAIYKIFKDTVPSSSTKPLTGHALGAAGSIETALCAKLLGNADKTDEETLLFPHSFDGEYDEALAKISLVKKGDRAKLKNVLNVSFGFGGTNAAIILGK